MLEEYTANLEQVGRTGTVIIDVNCGLSFMASAISDQKIVRTASGIRRTGKYKERVIKILSPCCQSDLFVKKTSKDFFCHRCTKAVPWKTPEFELSTDSNEAFGQWEEVLGHWFENTFERNLFMLSLIPVIEDVFDSIKDNKRLSEVVRFKPSVTV